MGAGRVRGDRVGREDLEQVGLVRDQEHVDQERQERQAHPRRDRDLEHHRQHRAALSLSKPAVSCDGPRIEPERTGRRPVVVNPQGQVNPAGFTWPCRLIQRVMPG